jgi:hypothetical protein
MAGARVLAVVVVVAVVLAGTWLYRRWQASQERGPVVEPRVPDALLGGAGRTWLLFTTPYCATCRPVEETLRASDPDARLVKIDATERPDLAGALSVRRAPTALLADDRGEIQARLVGADAVRAHLAALT